MIKNLPKDLISAASKIVNKSAAIHQEKYNFLVQSNLEYFGAEAFSDLNKTEQRIFSERIIKGLNEVTSDTYKKCCDELDEETDDEEMAKLRAMQETYGDEDELDEEKDKELTENVHAKAMMASSQGYIAFTNYQARMLQSVAHINQSIDWATPQQRTTIQNLGKKIIDDIKQHGRDMLAQRDAIADANQKVIQRTPRTGHIGEENYSSPETWRHASAEPSSAVGHRLEIELPKHAEVVIDSGVNSAVEKYRLVVYFVNSGSEFFPAMDLPPVDSIEELLDLVSDLPDDHGVISQALSDALDTPAERPEHMGNNGQRIREERR
jgi:hypothetical protein